MDHNLRSRHCVNLWWPANTLHRTGLLLKKQQYIVPKALVYGHGQVTMKAPEPDIVMVCTDHVPTLGTLAAVLILKQYLSELKKNVVNVVDLMKLQPETEHFHELSDEDFNTLFT